jgi:hypothetical protein
VAPPKPSTPPPPEDPLKTIDKLIVSDPGQAVAVLQPLVQAQPGKVNLQGNYLAALYRSRNAPDFNRAFTRATANGITTKGLITVPAFKAALVEEGQLQRKKPSAGLLSEDAFKRVVDGL